MAKRKAWLGEGRIDLLESIRKHGSISEAARQMNMSYKKAWNLVESMNNQASKPLVQRSSGGKGGGGTSLTPEGEKMIVHFKELQQRCAEYLEREWEEISGKVFADAET